MIVTYRPQDGNYDISINGVWHKDMIESPPEARELARIHRIQEDTVEDQTNLTTFFKMLIDGEA